MDQLSLLNRLTKTKSRSQKKTTSSQLLKQESFEFLGYPVVVLRRPYQRTIGVTVKPNGLIRVTVARSTTYRSINDFLHHCRDWLQKVLSEYKALRQKYPPKNYVQGEGFLLLGNYHYLDFRPYERKRYTFAVEHPELICHVPEADWENSFLTYPQPHIREPLLKFYEKQGREVLSKRVKIFSEVMGLYPKCISYRSQKTRWGSCGPEGQISLNWRLVAAPLETLDYVVIHELAHIAHPNHSKRFWQLVANYSPNYNHHRQWLKDHQYEFDFLAKRSELW